jgi:predicted ATP-dependent endonuclease of OLD family
MSGGERAVFPMLMDFASWNIHNSVILIDEIELHLHPPMQQALLRALPKLGKIISSSLQPTLIMWSN